MFRKPEITSYDQIDPIRKLYDNIFNDTELLGIEIEEKKAYSHLSNKYGPKLDKLIKDLERDLKKECLILDYKLSIQANIPQKGESK